MLEGLATDENTCTRALVVVVGDPSAAPDVAEVISASLFQCVRVPTLSEELVRSARAVIVMEDGDEGAAIATCDSVGADVQVFLVSPRQDLPFRLAAARAGVRAILRHPLDRTELRMCLADLADSTQMGHMSVVLVDDDLFASQINADILRSAGLDVTVVADPRAAVETIERVRPHLVLLDLRMPGVSGLDIAAVIRLLPHLVTTPILFLSGEHDAEEQAKARLAGGDDFIQKPIAPKKLIARVMSALVRARSLRNMSERDALTGLLARASFEEALHHALHSHDPIWQRFSLAMIDVDHFKRVNDEHGHLAGDKILRLLSKVLTSSLRASDVIGRCGGEEIGVLLPGVAAPDAWGIIDRVRASFAGATATSGIAVTLSAGIAEGRAFETATGLLGAADVALYRAKAGGRNRVERDVRAVAAAA